MSNGNGLIYLHNHENYNILKELSEVDGVLYYKGLPIISGDDIVTEYTDDEIRAMIISLWKSLGEDIELESGGKVINEYFATNEHMEAYVYEAVKDLVDGAIKVPTESGGDTSDNGES